MFPAIYPVAAKIPGLPNHNPNLLHHLTDLTQTAKVNLAYPVSDKLLHLTFSNPYPFNLKIPHIISVEVDDSLQYSLLLFLPVLVYSADDVIDLVNCFKFY